jgi:hypothetical protein
MAARVLVYHTALNKSIAPLWGEGWAIPKIPRNFSRRIAENYATWAPPAPPLVSLANRHRSAASASLEYGD